MKLVAGQVFDEIGSAVVNAKSREITLVGTKKVCYKDELSREHTINISSFKRWIKAWGILREATK